GRRASRIHWTAERRGGRFLGGKSDRQFSGQVLMEADFSVELGRDDPVLDFPWTDPDRKFAYFDLKRQPEMLARVEETKQYSELGEFLRVVNSKSSAVESAKCDAWHTEDLSPEEEIFGASHKMAGYVDLVFSKEDQ